MGNNIKIDVKVKRLKISAEFGNELAPVSNSLNSIKDRTSSIDLSTTSFSKRTLPHKVNTVVFKLPPTSSGTVPVYHHQ